MNRDGLSDLIRSGESSGDESLPADAPDEPYKVKRGSAWVTQVLAGTTTRDATDEEEVRLYQQLGRLRYDREPVPGSSFTDSTGAALSTTSATFASRTLRRSRTKPPGSGCWSTRGS